MKFSHAIARSCEFQYTLQTGSWDSHRAIMCNITPLYYFNICISVCALKRQIYTYIYIYYFKKFIKIFIIKRTV